MLITRRAFQRIALATIAVCLIALLGPRLVNADRNHVEIEIGHAYGSENNHEPKTRPVSQSSSDEIFLEESFPVRSGDMLEVELASADIVVQTGSSASQARVVIRGNGRDAAEEFARRRFSADYNGGTLHVRSDPERRRNRGDVRAGFTVEVTVPSRFNANMSLASGDVRVGDLVGSLELNTASGDIQIGSIQGPSISIQAASGDISAQRFDGPVSVSTASGDIEIQRIIGSNATLNSASGDIYVETAEANRVEAGSASGDVEIEHLIGQANVSTTSGDVSLHLADAADISTTSGTVSLRLPRNTGFDVDLQSPDIEIDNDLRFNGSRERRHTRGSLGSGGPRLEISTTSGSIELDTD